MNERLSKIPLRSKQMLPGKVGFRGDDRLGGWQTGDSKKLWTMRAYS